MTLRGGDFPALVGVPDVAGVKPRGGILRCMDGRPTYDKALSVVMWWDAFLSLAVALLAIVALPAVMFADVPRSVVIGVGVAAILAAVFLAGCGVVTAVLIGLRLRDGDDRLPEHLRLPLPRWMRPTLQDADRRRPLS